MAKRKAISKKVRFEIFKRDGFECQYCGATPPKAIMHVDHIVPVAEGGTNDEDNLITSCSDCNLGKGATPLEAAPQTLRDRASETKEREEQIRGYTQIMRAAKERLDDDAWDVAAIYMEQFDEETFRKDWLVSIKRFINELGIVDVIDAMERATAYKPYSRPQCFKYFCGICWNKISEYQNG